MITLVKNENPLSIKDRKEINSNAKLLIKVKVAGNPLMGRNDDQYVWLRQTDQNGVGEIDTSWHQGSYKGKDLLAGKTVKFDFDQIFGYA